MGGIHDPNKDYATGQVDPEVGKKILVDFVNQFIKKYPLLKVIDVTYHQSEASPHIHLDFVPMAKDDKFGLTASLDKACEQMGFGEPSKKDPNTLKYHIKYFEHDFHKLLDDICMKYGIEIDHPGLKRDHESVKQYKENEKLRQENAELESAKEKLEKEKNLLQKKSDKLAATLSEGLKAQEQIKKESKEALEHIQELTAIAADIDGEITEKKEELQVMDADHTASDLFLTLSDKVNERFQQIDFCTGPTKHEEYSKDDFRKQAIGGGYIVPEDALDTLLRNQYNFKALREMIENMFKGFKAYIKRVCEQMNQELVKKEQDIALKEKLTAPAYEEAATLKAKYANLVENAETEIRHEAYAQAKIIIEDMFGDPDRNTKGARAIAYLDKIDKLDDFERQEAILKRKAQNIDWD